MKTHRQIYEKEAMRILRDITIYRNMCKEQLYRLHPGIKPEVIEKILYHLQNNRRVFYEKEKQMLYASSDGESDMEIRMCLWVLCDFIEKTDFHTTSDFPVHLLFFMNGQVYEVTYIAAEKEAVYERVLSEMDSCGKRIIVLESEEQYLRLHIPEVTAYCTVDDKTGKVRYFKVNQEEDSG